VRTSPAGGGRVSARHPFFFEAARRARAPGTG
jgi:hypothetical protein